MAQLSHIQEILSSLYVSLTVEEFWRMDLLQSEQLRQFLTEMYSQRGTYLVPGLFRLRNQILKISLGGNTANWEFIASPQPK